MRSVALTLALLAGCSRADSADTTCRPPTCVASMVGLLYAEITAAPDTAQTTPDVPKIIAVELPVELDPSAAMFVLELPRTVRLTRKVQNGTKGIVVATRSSRILGRSDVVYQTQIDSLGSYELNLTPNLADEDYRVSLVIDGYPPYDETFAVTVDTAHNFSLPPVNSLSQLRGMLLDPLMKQPISGVQVQVVDPTTRRVLSTSVLSASDGSFKLALSPQYSVHVAELRLT